MSKLSPQRITSRYNSALENLNDAYKFASQGLIGKEQESLVSTATIIYEVTEWSIKFVLHKYFENDPNKFKTELSVVDGNSFYPKTKLFERYAVPKTSFIGLNFDLIRTQKQAIRNRPEHSGEIPHFETVLKLLAEVEKLIKHYIDATFNPIDIIKGELTVQESPVSKWDEFFDSCYSFEDNRNYILITSKLSDKNDLSALSYINWNLILDLDEDTEVSGLYKSIVSDISSKKKVHLFTKNDVQTLSPFNAVYWYAAKGLKGRQDTLVAEYKDWSKKYSNDTNKLIQNFAKVFGDRPTTVIVLSTDKIVLRLCELLFNNLDKSLVFVYAVENPSEIENVINDYEGFSAPIDIGTITKGLSDRSKYFKIENPVSVCLAPAAESSNVVIKQEDFFWIEEDFEFIHLNKLQNYQPLETETRRDFFRGNEISWFGLASNNDISRDKFKGIKKLIEKSLKDRKVFNFTLQHYPGIGGTTLGKRIAWEIHNIYPVVILRRYSSQETVNKLYSIYEYTKLPVLVISEASVIRIDDIERLCNEVSSRNFPCTFLTIQRKTSNGANHLNNNDSLIIPQSLSDTEFQLMLNVYKEITSNEQVAKLEEIERSDEGKYRHPFYMGLIAFEQNFEGLRSFVRKSLINSTPSQKKIMAFLAIAHRYAQKSIQAQYFSSILNWPESSLLNLTEHMNHDLLYLLVNDGSNEWRPLHYLISEELLKQILGGSDERLWKQNLSEYCIELISLNEESELHNTNIFLDLLERLFVFRDNEDLMGKEEDKYFSNVVDDIPTEEGKFLIFKKLTEAFPMEPHFWGHLARYYSFKRKDYENAIYAIDRAINLAERPNALLFHMKGMCLRAKVYDLIQQFSDVPADQTQELKRIQDLVEETEMQFNKCRQLNRLHEYGYISHIQLLINVIDFGYKISGTSLRSDFLLSSKSSYYQEHLDTAEELLSELKRIKSGTNESQYLLECDVKLKELYGDYSKAIQGWTNILSRIDVYKPPIRRQIARAYVRRKSSLENLDPKEIQRIVQLMEDNIIEEPGEEKNIFLWFNAMRFQQYVDMNRVLEKLSQWKTNHNSLEKTYYLYVLYSIDAIAKSSISKERAQSLTKECSEMARLLPNRTFCFEWFGKGTGIRQMISYKDAVTRDTNGDIQLQSLPLLTGKVTRIKGPEAGEIELSSGLTAFFIPARANQSKGLFKDKDINANVQFKIGFSYDGLRAWEVSSI